LTGGWGRYRILGKGVQDMDCCKEVPCSAVPCRGRGVGKFLKLRSLKMGLTAF